MTKKSGNPDQPGVKIRFEIFKTLYGHIFKPMFIIFTYFVGNAKELKRWVPEQLVGDHLLQKWLLEKLPKANLPLLQNPICQ